MALERLSPMLFWASLRCLVDGREICRAVEGGATVQKLVLPSAGFRDTVRGRNELFPTLRVFKRELRFAKV